MAQLKNTTIDDTGALLLPVGNTSQRPLNPLEGTFRFNNQLTIFESFKEQSWQEQKRILGNSFVGSARKPAINATEIIEKVPEAENLNGVYIINLPTVGPTPVYCDMTYNDPKHGKGWMLSGRVGTGTTFNILSNNWSDVTQFGQTVRDDTTENMKNNVWNYYNHTVLSTQFQQTAPSTTNWFNFTHNQNITMNQIFSWNNVNDGFLTFEEQFDTSGSYTTQLTNFLNNIGYTGTRPGSPHGRLGLNAFMSTGPSGVRLNANQISSGQAARSGVRIGYLGDNTAGGPVWPGQNGGPDDFGIGLAVQTCFDAGGCNVIVNTTWPGHFRLNAAGNGNTESWFTRCNLWVK